MSRVVEPFLRRLGPVPAWARILVVEDVALTHGPMTRVRKADLHDIADYEMRFQELLKSGGPWMNLNAAGLLGDALIIVIEQPRYQGGLPPDRVALVPSGPAVAKDGSLQWRLEGRWSVDA